MTLNQKIAEVKRLLIVIKKGWNKRTIYEASEVELDTEEGEYVDSIGAVPLIEGWYPVFYHMATLLGFSLQPHIRKDHSFSNDAIGAALSPRMVKHLMWEAEEFLNLMKGS